MTTATVERPATQACLICEHVNKPDASLCAECFAPMDLSRVARNEERDPHIVSVIGESNVGKTVYLGFLLDMLAQRAGDYEAIPRGAYSVDLQQTVIMHMAQRYFPPKTPMEANEWYWAYYQIRSRRKSSKWVDLVMPDMAGESLAAEVAAPKTFRVIHSLMEKSTGLLLLVDAALAAEGSAQPDFFATKALSYIDGIGNTPAGGRVDTPIAVVLCKADHCPECFDNPREFAKANLRRSWNLCDSRFEKVEFFAASVVGSMGYAVAPNDQYVTPVPMHTALRGVMEPFEWILERQ